MLLSDGFLEYIFTIGIIISFVALIIGVIKDRKNIKKTLIDSGFRLKDLTLVIAILLVFIFIEVFFIKATQLLFFDDVIYQAMAVMFLHTGQAWMCNYGTPSSMLFRSGLPRADRIIIQFCNSICIIRGNKGSGIRNGVRPGDNIRSHELLCLASSHEEQECGLLHRALHGAVASNTCMGQAHKF